MKNKDVKEDVFLLSGWGADQRSWTYIADFLAQKFNLHFIDLADSCYAIDVLCDLYGKTEGSSENAGGSLHKADGSFHEADGSFHEADGSYIKTYNEKLIQKIGEGLPSSCHLIGWSLGGMVATQVAAKFSGKVLSLMTLASNIGFVESEHWPVAMSSKTFNEFVFGFDKNAKKTVSRFVSLQLMGDENRKAITPDLKRTNIYFEQTLTTLEHQRALALLNLLQIINNAELITQITVPLMMMFADGDALVPVAVVNELKSLDVHDLEIHIIEQCGHAMQLSHPEKVVQALSMFYKKVGGSSLSSETSLSLGNATAYRKDKKKIARSFSAAAQTYDSVAQLQRDVADELLKLQFNYSGVIADLGCGTGYCTQKILNRRSDLHSDLNTGADVDLNVVCLDLAEGMLQFARQKTNDPRARCVGGDIESLPLQDESVDGIVSSLSIQWSDDLDAVFSEASRVLKPGGWVLCSSLGPSTLHELNKSWMTADPSCVHVNQFLPALNVLDAAELSNFNMSEFCVEPKVLSYSSVLDLMKDLKSLGAHNINQGYSNNKNRGLTGKTVFRKLFDAYEDFRRPDHTLPATYEVIYLLLTKKL